MSRYNVYLLPEAFEEEYEAYVWYKNQRENLGEEFLIELKKGVDKISANPNFYGFIDGKKVLRDYRIERFPYMIVYRIVASSVEIVAIHHAKKDKK